MHSEPTTCPQTKRTECSTSPLCGWTVPYSSVKITQRLSSSSAMATVGSWLNKSSIILRDRLLDKKTRYFCLGRWLVEMVLIVGYLRDEGEYIRIVGNLRDWSSSDTLRLSTDESTRQSIGQYIRADLLDKKHAVCNVKGVTQAST